jgi:hypothetical protein
MSLTPSRKNKKKRIGRLGRPIRFFLLGSKCEYFHVGVFCWGPCWRAKVEEVRRWDERRHKLPDLTGKLQVWCNPPSIQRSIGNAAVLGVRSVVNY